MIALVVASERARAQTSVVKATTGVVGPPITSIWKVAEQGGKLDHSG